MLNHKFCVAPMMDWTDRHDRVFLRQFSRRTLLYTEMVTSAALIRGDADYLLAHDPCEHPVALQLGGSKPSELSAAAVCGAQRGFDEINLNVGCPSDRVQSGSFGASLMAHPGLVAECVAAMADSVDVPVTVKCRIGIDDHDSEAALVDFIATVAKAGCEIFIIHARKAILTGLSPKQNREIPPLDYQRVFRIKQRFPDLTIVINGGITSLYSAHEMLEHVDGVMLGREAYQNPYLLHDVDYEFFGAPVSAKSRLDYLHDYMPYVRDQLALGTPLHHMTRHILGLFRGVKGGRRFRRHLSEFANRPGTDIQVLEQAIEFVN